MKKKIKTLSEIKPNAGIRASYSKALRDELVSMHNSIVYWLIASYKQEDDEITQDSAFDNISKRFNSLKQKWNKRWSIFSKRTAFKFILSSQKDAQVRLNRAFKNAGINLTVKNTRALNMVTKSLVADNVRLIKSIQAQHFDDVFGIVMRGISQGNDVNLIKKQIKERFYVREKRAKFIAVDQTNKASQAIQRVNDLDLGITQGKWKHYGGQKTSRLTHSHFDGQVFDLSGPNKGLYDSDVNKRVMPGELYNCRCFYLRVLPENLR